MRRREEWRRGIKGGGKERQGRKKNEWRKGIKGEGEKQKMEWK